jgi:hypothetical protein
MRIVVGVGNLVQRTEDGRTGRILGGRGSRGQVVPCAVCTVHVETRSVGFLVEPQNQGQWFVSGFPFKPLDGFLRFGLKTSGDDFLVELENQGAGGFPGLGLKIDSYGLVIWPSKLLQRFLGLGFKTMHASVYRLHHKTSRRMRRCGTHF